MCAYPRAYNIVTEYAAWLRDHNHPDEARALYFDLIERAPRDYRAHYGYGRLLFLLGEFEPAIEQFRETIKIHKGHRMAHDGLAQALKERGKISEQKGHKEEADAHFTEAEREFHQAIYWAGIGNQSQAVFNTNLGWFYIDRQRYAHAIEAFEAALNEDVEFFGNYWGIGRAKLEQRQFEEALYYLRIALDRAPEDYHPPRQRRDS